MVKLLFLFAFSFLISGCTLPQKPAQKNTMSSIVSSVGKVSIPANIGAVPDKSKQTIQIEHNVLTVEVVNKVASITTGLSGRDEIGSDGMLFVFPDSAPRTFWMKDMKFDLDMIWINQGTVIGVSRAVAPEAGTEDKDLEIYYSPSDADMVLEVPAGTAEKYISESK